MIDWNGNGKIDEVDIGISIAMENAAEENKNVSFIMMNGFWEGKLMINYCNIYGDSDEKNLYLDISDKIKVDYCAAQNVAHIAANSWVYYRLVVFVSSRSW